MVVTLLAIRWFLALVLLRAGIAKALDPARFSRTIARYRIIPARHVPAVARSLPAVETGTGVTLAIGLVPLAAGACACLLFLAFAVVVGVNVRRGRRFQCGCAGPDEGQIGWPLVARNIGLAASAAAVAVGPAGLAATPVGPFAAPLGRAGVPAVDLVPVPLSVIVAGGMLLCVRSFVASRPCGHRPTASREEIA